MSLDTTTRAPETPVEEPRKIFGMTITPPKRGGSASGRSGKGAALVVGGAPRANLLPPEIILKRTQRKTRQKLRVGVFAVAIAVAAGCVGSVAFSTAAAVQASAAQQELQGLVNQQLEYAQVKGLQDTIKAIHAGQQVGASTEIDWRDYLTSLQNTLPAGVTIDTVSVEEGTPMAAFAQPTAPLQGSRVASLTFTAVSTSLPSIPDWLRSMAKLPGFVDATPGSVKLEDGVYKADVLMHINTDAFTLRFDPATIAANEAAAAAAETPATTTEGN